MKQYNKPIIIEEEVIVEDVIAASGISNSFEGFQTDSNSSYDSSFWD